jgi:hypothetical protein
MFFSSISCFGLSIIFENRYNLSQNTLHNDYEKRSYGVVWMYNFFKS